MNNTIQNFPNGDFEHLPVGASAIHFNRINLAILTAMESACHTHKTERKEHVIKTVREAGFAEHEILDAFSELLAGKILAEYEFGLFVTSLGSLRLSQHRLWVQQNN